MAKTLLVPEPMSKDEREALRDEFDRSGCDDTDDDDTDDDDTDDG